MPVFSNETICPAVNSLLSTLFKSHESRYEVSFPDRCRLSVSPDVFRIYVPGNREVWYNQRIVLGYKANSTLSSVVQRWTRPRTKFLIFHGRHYNSKHISSDPCVADTQSPHFAL